VPPFLCSRTPLLDVEVRTFDSKLLRKEPFNEARFCGAVPSFVAAERAKRLADAFGARLLSEAEWEYLARDAIESQVDYRYRDWEGAVDDLHGRPAFGDIAQLRSVAELSSDNRDEDEELTEEDLILKGYDDEYLEGYLSNSDNSVNSAFAVWGLQFGEWVADSWHSSYVGAPENCGAWEPSAVPGMTRGGGVLSYPWQDEAEALFAHAAFRSEEKAYAGLATVRLVLGL
jgi:formylglycine-generating enzyme required for sulfatase activity